MNRFSKLTTLFFLPLALAPSLAAAEAPIVVADVGLDLPESVLHDESADVYLVSNLTLHPQLFDNGGFISRLAPDGAMLDLKWLEGGVDGVELHAPKGMAILGGTLYVADLDAVRLFELATGEPTGSIDVWSDDDEQPEFPFYRGHFLNDLCLAPGGTLYMTDSGFDVSQDGMFFWPTGTDAVLRLEGDLAVPWVASPELKLPNGCVALGANVFVVTWGSNEILRVKQSKKIVPHADLYDGERRLGLLDGIVRVRDSFYVTSWVEFGPAGGVYEIHLSGAGVKPLLTEVPSPADLGYDAVRDRLLVPLALANAVVLLPLD